MYRMIQENGVVTTEAICDACKTGYVWKGIVSFSRLGKNLRQYKGWKIGVKRQICAECVEKEKRENIG